MRRRAKVTPAFAARLYSDAEYRSGQTAHAGIIQRLGKFSRIAAPGLNIKVPFIDSLVRTLSLQVQQLDVRVETRRGR